MTIDHDRDWHEAEDRTEDGYPAYCRSTTKPRTGLKLAAGAAVGGPINVDNSADHSRGKQVNPAIPWIIATGVAALSIGVVLGVTIGQDGRIQAEGRAVRAEVHQEFADRLARQDAQIAEAKQKSDLAMDWTEQKNAELKAYRSR